MRANRWLLMLVVVLAGCSLAPTYVRPPTDNPDAWRVDYKDAADTANTRWWELFDDPVLNQLIDTALKENKDVRIAAARVEEFAARVDIFRAGYFPQIGYDGEATRNRVSREVYGGGAVNERKYNNYTAGASLGWELDLWGRIRNSTEAARAELLAQEDNRRAVILSLVSAVASTYVNLRQYDRQLEVSKETLASRAESLRLFDLKRKGRRGFRPRGRHGAYRVRTGGGRHSAHRAPDRTHRERLVDIARQQPPRHPARQEHRRAGPAAGP